MSWLALLLVPLALYLAYKLVGVVVKVVLAVVVVVAVYWWAAPQMGWPTVPDLFYVLGPDFEGRRIEEVADPSHLAGQAAEKMVDGVVDEVVERSGIRKVDPPAPMQPDDAPQEPAPATDPPQTPQPL